MISYSVQARDKRHLREFCEKFPDILEPDGNSRYPTMIDIRSALVEYSAGKNDPFILYEVVGDTANILSIEDGHIVKELRW